MRSLVGIFALVALAGCQSARSVEGTWSTSGTLIPEGSRAETTFGGDGKAQSKIIVSSNGVEIAAVVDGTYKVNGDKITVTVDDVQLTDIPPALKLFEGQAKEIARRVGQQGVGTLKWDSDTQFTIVSENGPTTTFKKK